MQVFNARHFLRHIGMPMLREFADAHVLAAHLAHAGRIDWSQPADVLPTVLCNAVEGLERQLADAALPAGDREALEHALLVWADDLRRAHLMANGLALAEFRSACQTDEEALAAFAVRDEREIALWMLAFREKTFRDVELHLAFQARTNGKFWKKQRIQSGLNLSRDRAQLEQFCHAVARLYKHAGAGEGVHIELSERRAPGATDTASSIQLTIYVEGPVTALAHFAQSHFTRITTRIALETALVYHPATGMVETLVKGGARNHAAVLVLFGQHVVQQAITPERIEPQRYRLNALRDGLEPFEDWSVYGVETVRLRRARLTPASRTGIRFSVEASPDKRQDDAIRVARDGLKVQHLFETEYHLEAATVIVYTRATGNARAGHFSFDIRASGASTIKNLPPRHQALAHKVLQTLLVIDTEEPPPQTEPMEEAVAA